MTELLYLENTYQFEAEAKVLVITETERGLAIVLDQTIFYPQGGGQPYDTGVIALESAEFLVREVRLDHDGTVYHFGEFKFGEFAVGSLVQLKIDHERRLEHARLHSAGHLIDVAIVNLAIPNLTPVKGYHFSDGPFIEYEGTLTEPQSYVGKLETELASLIAADLPITAVNLSAEEAAKQGVKAPRGKTARLIKIGDYPGVGCGGTHVKSTKEIGAMGIRKISSKKGRTRVCYWLLSDTT